MNVNCDFCNKIPTLNNQPLTRDWYDFFIMLEENGFIAVPAIGSLVPGYILVVYKKHIYSMAQLPQKKIKTLLKFSAHISSIQKKLWGSSAIFEHGGCSVTEDAGSCINHAHWHIVPVDFDIRPQKYEFKKVPSFESFASRNQGKQPYLLYINNSDTYICENALPEKQIFRKCLSKR